MKGSLSALNKCSFVYCSLCAFQSCINECYQLHITKIKALSKINNGPLTQVVYITGQPGLDKTQLAREFGPQYFQKKKGYIF